MDACTIPLSTSEWYGISMSNKFFEYSACGKPVLLKPSPGIMALGWDNSFIYEDYSEFVEEIKYLMNNPKEYRPDVEPFSWKKRADDIEKILYELVDKNSKKQ
jgi:glycosyltransferase involved in cell wall biosynthesis